MKVTLSPVDESDDWKIELEVEKETTIAQFKAKVAEQPDAPSFTKSSRILFKGAQGPMYSLQDNERVKKTMLFADPSAVKKPAPPVKAAAQPKAEPMRRPSMDNSQAQPKAAAAPRPAAKPQAAPKSPQAQAPAPQAAPKAAQAAARRPEDRFFNFPYYDDWSLQQKKNVTLRMQSAWTRTGDPKRSSLQVLDMLRAQLSLIDPKDPCLVSITSAAFGMSSDLLEYGPSGLAHVHEVIVFMADEIFRRFQPLLSRYGYPNTVTGYCDMDKAITSYLENTEVQELMQKIWPFLCFGGRDYRIQRHSTTQNILFMGIQSPTVQLVTQSQSYLHHLGLSPLERRRRSGPRTIAFVEALLMSMLQSRIGRKKTASNRRVVWILGASDTVEGALAQGGYYEDAAAFHHGDQMHIHLVGDQLSGTWPTGTNARVHAHSWSELYAGSVPDPELVMLFNTGIGTLEPGVVGQWLPRLVDLLAYPSELAPVVVLTSRCLAEVQGEERLLHSLQAVPFMPTQRRQWPWHMRNIYSGMAGHPTSDYDDNGWLIAVSGSFKPREELLKLPEHLDDLIKYVQEQHVSDFWSEQNKPQFQDGRTESAEASGDQSPKKKDPAVFWGILDLKYVPEGPLEARVKVLETGDGRSSRFSGYGAAILENFKQDNKLEDTLRRAVLVENKKLTHDIILDCGYAHLRPQQECLLKEYTTDLARNIRRELRLRSDEDICVLKLPNRTRGAGVIPIRCSELDEALRVLLQPPEDINAWLLDRDARWARTVSWGCFEEQLRHWWSNESPCFLVEEFCCSTPTLKEIDDGAVLPFDGTMRVGFSLHREPEQKLPPGWVHSDNGPLFVGTMDQDGPIDPAKQFALERQDPSNRPCYNLYPSGPDVLRLQWLGGYWKLPVEDTSSPDLRGRVVSVAKRGTAPVPAWQLHEVYAALGDAVSLVFNTKDISHTSLLKRYSGAPEWGAFVVGRLACSMRIRDRDKSKRILQVAQSIVQNLKGVPRDLVASYIERNQGVVSALFQRWSEACDTFRKSLTTFPANATSRFLVGFCLLEQGDPKQAIRYMEESLLLDPDFKAPYINIGLAWLRLGEYDRAIEVCEAGDKRHPNTPWCLYNLGVARYAVAAAAEQGQTGNVDDGPRAKALHALEFARDNVGKDGPWSEQDDQLVESLKDASKALPVRPAYDGWRFINYRP